MVKMKNSAASVMWHHQCCILCRSLCNCLLPLVAVLIEQHILYSLLIHSFPYVTLLSDVSLCQFATFSIFHPYCLWHFSFSSDFHCPNCCFPFCLMVHSSAYFPSYGHFCKWGSTASTWPHSSCIHTNWAQHWHIWRASALYTGTNGYFRKSVF